jgi:hypothetical protein
MEQTVRWDLSAVGLVYGALGAFMVLAGAAICETARKVRRFKQPLDVRVWAGCLIFAIGWAVLGWTLTVGQGIAAKWYALVSVATIALCSAAKGKFGLVEAVPLPDRLSGLADVAVSIAWILIAVTLTKDSDLPWRYAGMGASVTAVLASLLVLPNARRNCLVDSLAYPLYTAALLTLVVVNAHRLREAPPLGAAAADGGSAGGILSSLRELFMRRKQEPPKSPEPIPIPTPGLTSPASPIPLSVLAP